jgi:hypothetical protein
MQTPQNSPETFAGTTADLRQRLQVLYLERALAAAEGLGENETYMADLEDEIAATRSSYVGAAVTEIASFRGQLFGRPQG